MRLIDADTLRKEVEKDRDASDMPKMWYQGVEYAINHIIHAPTVDAVEVVRCKDCFHFWDGVCKAHIDVIYVDDNDFCSYGERRKDETGKG